MNFEGNAAGDWTRNENQDAGRMGRVSPATSEAKVKDDAGERLAAEMNVFNTVATELRQAMNCDACFEDRVSGIMKAAADLFGVAPTWTAFYREVLGAEGMVRTVITAGDEMAAFECSNEHTSLLGMLTTLRSRDLPENDPFEQQRMITVRIPKSLHDSICAEANELSVSVNKLCISRLLQMVDRKMIPSSTQKRRGRRPGSAGKAEAVAVTATPAPSVGQVAPETVSSTPGGFSPFNPGSSYEA